MILSNRSKHSGFTLVELAIVLAVAGVLFVGLWRLMSGGNQQVRDQSAASQQIQLINSVKAYLGSTDGQSLMTTVGASSTFIITLPSVPPDGGANTGCMGSITTGPDVPHEKSICNYLPTSFSSGTTNAYNQSYNVRGITGPTGSNSYSFMVLTTGGDAIPDASGGRIAAAIGGDGGFLYSTAVCPTSGASTAYACGSYGTWYAQPVATYGFGSAPVGHVVSRTYLSATQDSGLPWLERNLQIQPDPTFAFNTMSTNLYVTAPSGIYMATAGTTTSGGSIFMNGGSITLASSITDTANAGALYMNAGAIYLQGGLIQDTTGTGQLSFSLTGDRTGNSPIVVGTNCTLSATTISGLDNTNPACKPGIAVAGDQTVSGELFANQLYANTFIYQSSDARLKTDIHPIQHSLDDIIKLKPVDFTFKANNKKSIGFIAQDVEKIYPELVSQNPEGMKAVNYDGLIAPLIGAVQELKAQNDVLRQKLEAQDLRQNALQQHLDELTEQKRNNP